MALVIQEFTLDITPGGIPPVLHVTEYDENMQVVVHLLQRWQAFTIPTGTTAKVEGTLDGHPFSADATVDGRNVTFELTKGMTAYAGRAWTKIKLTKDGKPVSTCGFWLECDRAGVEAGDVIGAPGFEEQIKDAVDELLDEHGGITLGVNEFDGLVYIFIGGRPVGNGLDLSSGGGSTDTVYGRPVADTASYELTGGQTATLGIKLSRKPTQEQTITLLSDSDLITFSVDKLIFTAADWSDMQFVTITIGSFDVDTTASIIMRNSDDLMTDTMIPVYLVADKYSVDMTIPDGQHICTVDDFTVYSSGSGYVILGAYTGAYDNIKVPATMTYQGTTVSVMLRDSFSGNTTVQYIEIADNVGFNKYGNAAVCSHPAFGNCTNLIGVKFDDPSELSSLGSCFINCSSLKWVDGISDASKSDFYMAFSGCTAIEYIPAIHSTVGDFQQTFNGCTALKKIYGISTNATNFSMAFYGCSSLKKIVGGISESCTNLFFAFSGCVALHEITINAAEVTKVDNIFEKRSGSQIDVYVPANSTTKTNLTSLYGSSTDVRLHDIGTGDTAQPIVVWGDSTSSPNTPWTCWPDRLQSQITDAYAIKNQAVSGEYTTSTSARQGGNALYVGAFTIPSGTESVEITLRTEDGHTFSTSPVFSAGGSFNPCLISGVKGTISASNGVYKFSRLEAGDTVSVADGTPATSVADTILNTADCIMLINLGINSGWDQNANVLLNQVQLMVDHFAAAGGTKYIICGPCAGQHLRTDALRQVVIDYESKAATAFGDHWLNLREYLIDNGLTENGLTASDLDTERMASGLVPASLLGGGSTTDIKMYDGTTVTDDTHPNAYGAESIKNAFYAKGQALGYWD